MSEIRFVRYRHYIHLGEDWERYPVSQPASEAVGETMNDGRVIMGAFDLAIIDGDKPPKGQYACTNCGVLYPTPAALAAHRETGE